MERSAPIARPLASLRWVLLIGLLIVEAAALTVVFDSGSVRDVSGWWAWVVGESPRALQIGISVVAGIAILGGASLWRAAREAAYDHPTQWSFLAVHLLAYLAFAGLTDQVFGGSLTASAHAGVWAGAWLGAGLVTAAAWAAAVIHPARWFGLVRLTWPALLLGMGVGIAATITGWLATEFWRPLAGATLLFVDALLRIASLPTITDPAERLVGTPSFAVTIAAECSGYEGIGLMLAFLAAYLWFFRANLRFPQALVLIPAGIAAAWLANSVRIALLVMIGHAGWIDIARGGFHSQAGWLSFNAIALGMVVATQRLAFFNPTRSHVRPANPAAPYLVPMLTLVGLMMVTTAVQSGFDYLYPLRVANVGGVLWYFRKNYRVGEWTWSWGAAAIGAAVFVLWMALEPAATDAAGRSPVAAGLTGGWAAAWLIARCLGSVLVVPLAEELAFRGYLQRRLVDAEFEAVPPDRIVWIPWVLSSLAFGLLHGRWLAGGLAGMLFGWALYRRGKLCDAFVAHAVANALIAAYVLGWGEWSLWG